MSYATFNRFEIKMTREQAGSCAHPGPCDSDVAFLLTQRPIARQLDKIGTAPIREELREYGAWSDVELADDAQNRARIVWIAAGDIWENK